MELTGSSCSKDGMDASDLRLGSDIIAEVGTHSFGESLAQLPPPAGKYSPAC